MFTSVELVEGWCIKGVQKVRKIWFLKTTETTTSITTETKAHTYFQKNWSHTHLLGTSLKISLTHCSNVSSFSKGKTAGHTQSAGKWTAVFPTGVSSRASRVVRLSRVSECSKRPFTFRLHSQGHIVGGVMLLPELSQTFVDVYFILLRLSFQSLRIS